MRPEGQSGQYLGVQSSGALQNGIRAVHQPEVGDKNTFSVVWAYAWAMGVGSHCGGCWPGILLPGVVVRGLGAPPLVAVSGAGGPYRVGPAKQVPRVDVTLKREIRLLPAWCDVRFWTCVTIDEDVDLVRGGE